MWGSNEWTVGVNVTPVLLGWPILFREFVFWEVEAIGGGMCVCGSQTDHRQVIECHRNFP